MKIPCPHWTKDTERWGFCAIQKFGKPAVSNTSCRNCLGLPHSQEKPAGRISLRVVVAPEIVAERERICGACAENVGGMCQEQKRREPKKKATIAWGVRMPDAHCPLGKWAALTAFVRSQTPASPARVFAPTTPAPHRR